MAQEPTGASDGPGTPAPDREIELKLTADPAALRRLHGAPAIVRRAVGGGSTSQLESIYYDTPDLRLMKRNLALRVRRSGAECVQTLKSGGAEGGVMRRGEWEVPVPSMKPDLDAISAAEARRRLGALRSRELTSVFASRIKREVRRLRDTGSGGEPSEIEVAFDKGVVKSARGSEKLAEIELQLLKGTPESLYRIALELHETIPLRVETQSKSARGYAMIANEPPRPSKAAKLRLAVGITVDGALEAVVRAGFAHWTANEAAALAGGDPEGVHQMRVALRRLLTALTLFRKAIPEEQRDWLRGELKWLIGSLGPARDWDIFLTELAPAAEPARPSAAHKAVLGLAERLRADAYQAAREAIRSPRYTRLMLRLGVWIEGHGWRTGDGAASRWLGRPMAELATRVLEKRYRALLKLGRDFESLGREDRHRVRIAVKKLRYIADFTRALFRKGRAEPYQKALARLQDSMGRFNDAAIAEHLVADLVAGLPPARGRPARVAAARALVRKLSAAAARDDATLIEEWRRLVAGRPFWRRAEVGKRLA